MTPVRNRPRVGQKGKLQESHAAWDISSDITFCVWARDRCPIQGPVLALGGVVSNSPGAQPTIPTQAAADPTPPYSNTAATDPSPAAVHPDAASQESSPAPLLPPATNSFHTPAYPRPPAKPAGQIDRRSAASPHHPTRDRAHHPPRQSCGNCGIAFPEK